MSTPTPITPQISDHIAVEFADILMQKDPKFIADLDYSTELLPICKDIVSNIMQSMLKNPKMETDEIVVKMWSRLSMDTDELPKEALEWFLTLFQGYKPFDRAICLGKDPDPSPTPSTTTGQTTKKKAISNISSNSTVTTIAKEIRKSLKIKKKIAKEITEAIAKGLINNPDWTVEEAIKKTLPRANKKDADKILEIFEKFNSIDVVEDSVRDNLLTQLRGEADPITKYLKINRQDPEYKPTRDYIEMGNEVHSAKTTISILKVFERVGKAFFFISILMGIYSLHIDLQYHMGQTFKDNDTIAWITAIALSVAITLVAEYGLRGVINQKFRDYKTAFYLIITITIVFSTTMYFLHYRFGVIIAEANTKGLADKTLANSSTVAGKTASNLANNIKDLQVDLKDKRDDISREKKVLSQMRLTTEQLTKQYNKYLKRKSWADKQRLKKVMAQQQANKGDILTQKNYIAQLEQQKKDIQDTIKSKSSSVVSNISSLNSSLSSKASANAIFVWVIFFAIELLGLMAILGQILAVAILPQPLKDKIHKLGWNESMADMLTAHIKDMEFQQITAHDMRLKQDLEKLKVNQAVQIGQTSTITDVIVNNAIENKKTLANAILIARRI